MALTFNGTSIYQVNYNGTSINQINLNGTPVWYSLNSCTISGTALVGYTWTCAVNPSAIQNLCSYQWYRGNSAISGATSRTYTTTAKERGSTIKCRVTIGTASVMSNISATIQQSVTKLTIIGEATEGSVINAYTTPALATGTYQWYRGTTAISGATSSSYTIVNADRTYKIKCVFTANGNYTGSVTSGQTSAVVGWKAYTNLTKTGYFEDTASPFAYDSGIITLTKPIGKMYGTITGSVWSQRGHETGGYSVTFYTSTGASTTFSGYFWDPDDYPGTIDTTSTDTQYVSYRLQGSVREQSIQYANFTTTFTLSSYYQWE